MAGLNCQLPCGHRIPYSKSKTQMTTASARHILVETEAECARLKKRIQDGEDFADLASHHSKCPSRNAGGSLGTFGRGEMVPEFDIVVFSAPLNEVQGPVKTQFGYHLIEVTERNV